MSERIQPELSAAIPGLKVGCRGYKPLHPYYLLLTTQPLTTDYFICGLRINLFGLLTRNFAFCIFHFAFKKADTTVSRICLFIILYNRTNTHGVF